MDVSTLPTVFKDFSAHNSAASLVSQNTFGAQNNPSCFQAEKNTNKDTSAFSHNDDEKIKKHKKHPILKAIIKTALGVLAATYIITSIRHGAFGDVDPEKILYKSNDDLWKKSFIKFSDQVEVKRNVTARFIKRRIDKFKEVIRRNFFSYNQNKPEELTPFKKMPQKAKSAALNEIEEFKTYFKEMKSRIKVIYPKPEIKAPK